MRAFIHNKFIITKSQSEIEYIAVQYIKASYMFAGQTRLQLVAVKPALEKII